MSKKIYVWDKFVRVFHWSLVIGLCLNWFVLDEGDTVHQWLGISIASLVCARIIWGFVGSPYARFASFWPSLSGVRHHLALLIKAKPDHTLGHNPAGGAMILCLLAAVLTTAFSGWLMTTDAFWGTEWLESLHELAAHSIQFAAAIHIAAVIYSQKVSNAPLIKAMITGYKTPPPQNKP